MTVPAAASASQGAAAPRTPHGAGVLAVADVVGVLLAAGAATRFGGGKLLVPLQSGADAGVPLGVAACRRLRLALPRVVAVVRPGDDALASALAASGAQIAWCADAADGMGASLACGIEAARAAHGWLVALADMPWIEPATIAALAARVAAGADIVVPRYRGQRGHPVGFTARHGDALRALRGDHGARAIVAAHAATVVDVDVDDCGVVRDVDTPADLAPRAG